MQFVYWGFQAGHHVQEDRGEELGEVIKGVIRRTRLNL